MLLTASDDRHDDDIQTAETGEAYGAHDCYDDLPSPRWRDRLVIVIAVIALAGLGAVGAFAYRAVFAGTVMPARPPIIKAENAPNENVPNYGDDRPSDLSQTTIASAGSSEEFVSRWSADIQEPPKTAPISPNPSASPPSAPGSGAVATIAPALAAPPPANAPLALTATSLPPAGTRTVFLDAEEDQDGHSWIGRVRKSRYLGRGYQITRGKDERRSGGHSSRKSASA